MSPNTHSSDKDLAPESPEMVGIFGPLEVIPLISELLPQPIINAAVRGFAAERSNASGLAQNDGRIMPSLDHRKKDTFCDYCTLIRDSAEGGRRCRECDTDGIRLLLGIPLSEDSRISPLTSFTGQVKSYFCHADCLEMIAPVRVFFGDYGSSESVIVGALWGGQHRVKRSEQFKADSDQLARILHVPRNELEHAYLSSSAESSRQSGDLAAIEESLSETANAISWTITDLYQRRENRIAFQVLEQVTDALDLPFREPPDRAPNEAAFLAAISKGFHIFERAYDLAASELYRVENKRDEIGIVLTPFSRATQSGAQVVKSARSQFSPSGTASIQATGSPVVTTADSDPLLAKLARSTGCVREKQTVSVVTFSTRRAGRFLWFLAEHLDRKWQIRPQELQPAFGRILHEVADRIIVRLDTIALLAQNKETIAELDRSRAEVRREQIQREHVIRRMSHLVSRPMLQLRLSAESFQRKPYEPTSHQAFKAALVELRRASKNFQSFTRLTSTNTETSKQNRTRIDLLSILSAVEKTLEPLAKLERRPIDVVIEKESYVRAVRVYASSEFVTDILENIMHNGIKYSLGGRPVEIAVRRTGNGIDVSCTNYGCGILAEEAEKIFEFEYRSELVKGAQVEGTGIGLWIAKQLATLEGFELSLTSYQSYDFLDNGVERFMVTFRLTVPV